MADVKHATGTPVRTLDGTEVVAVQVNPNGRGPLQQTTTQAIADLAASVSAQFIVATATTGLSAERVATDTATVAWDFGTAAQAKASVPDGSITLAKQADLAQNKLIGRATASTGVPEAVGLASSLAMSGGNLGVPDEGITLAKLEHGTNGQVPVATTSAAVTYKTLQAATATNVAEARSGHVTYMNPAAESANAGACAIVVDVVVVNGAQIVGAQPDFPRKLILYITDGDVSILTGTLDLVGIGTSGEAVTESIDLTGGTASKTSTKAYATLTSATVANLTGNDGADKIALGIATALGLPGNKTPASSTFAVHKSSVNAANEAVGTVDATAGTIVPTTVPNGTNDYDFWFTYAVTPTQNSHTHTWA